MKDLNIHTRATWASEKIFTRVSDGEGGVTIGDNLFFHREVFYRRFYTLAPLIMLHELCTVEFE